MLPQAGAEMFPIVTAELLRLVEQYVPEMYLGHAVSAVTESGVVLRETAAGEETALEADCVVLSLGVTLRSALAQEFRAVFDNTICVGGNEKVGRFPNAAKEAYSKSLVFLK